MNDRLAGTVDLPASISIRVERYSGPITKISKDQPIIIEGIHVLNRKLTEKIDDKSKYKIYISPLTQLNIDNHNRIPITDARLLRRIARDHQFRGYDASKTLEQWPKVYRRRQEHFPYNGEADMLFNSAIFTSLEY